ncbi:hypothetical protein COV13_03380 [Candidatus Woesearchaeota archaeon CG10_big_fil_rev_8_21_14_0_10_32_9]|nr:MAG: hypothetical protein COV13_03380 [Candidatus Woesearchaeota archaeon CG10_big_fil_rev_8_21_14_0_10_32_9]
MSEHKKAIIMASFFVDGTKNYPLFGYELEVLDYIKSEIEHGSTVYFLPNKGQINIGPITIGDQTTLNEIDDALKNQTKIFPPYIEGRTFLESDESYHLQQLKVKQKCFEDGIDEVIILCGPAHKYEHYPIKDLEAVFENLNETTIYQKIINSPNVVGMKQVQLKNLSEYKPKLSTQSFFEVQELRLVD